METRKLMKKLKVTNLEQMKRELSEGIRHLAIWVFESPQDICHRKVN